MNKFGCTNSDGSFQDGYIDSDGIMRFSKIREKWFKIEKIDKYFKDKWFGGRKYYIIIRVIGLKPSVFTLSVNEEDYYNDNNQAHMYSLNGHTWVFRKEDLNYVNN